ncbi:hypothetical protein OTB20_17690 [Streptomyces sp. H27-H1]|nr:hypothetical protein [Streptomyces sp. H27-H1]
MREPDGNGPRSRTDALTLHRSMAATISLKSVEGVTVTTGFVITS